MSRWLTTAQAAEISGVGATAIKRWADHGQLQYVRTAGGHRRFDPASLAALLRERPFEAPKVDDERALLDELLARSDGFAVESELLRIRARKPTWAAAAETVGAVLRQLGQLYERGDLSVIEEHLASERLSRAVTSISGRLPVSSARKSVLLTTVESDEHVLGLALAELCFRECAYPTLWSGRKSPAEELALYLSGGRVQILAVSASVAMSQDVLVDWLDILLPACEKNRVALILGGAGPWPASGQAIRTQSFVALHELLEHRV